MASSSHRSRARWFESSLQDLRYAVRGLTKTPGFTITVVVVLALGIGANASMFTLVDRLFFREPSGIVDPARVVTATEVFSQGGFAMGMQPRMLALLEESVKDMATVALTRNVFAGIDHATGPRVVEATDNYFSMLGVRMERGRFFSLEEAADSLPVAVVSYPYWQRALNGDSAVLGRSIEIAKKRYTVIGVAARGFTGTTIEQTDVWLPMSRLASGGLIMRLNAGVTSERVDAAMTLALRQALGPPRSTRFQPPTMRSSPLILGRSSGSANAQFELIVRVAGVAGIILLVAIANAATLLLMRATRRRREIAVRLALGVSRARLMQQLLVEGVVLSLAAGVAALIAGVWGGAVARTEFMQYYRLDYPLLDWRLTVFTFGIAIAAGILGSLAPAFHASRPDLTQSLKVGEGGRHGRTWFQGTLVVLQVALSVVLVAGAGVFIRSLHNIRSVPLGMDVNDLLSASIHLQQSDSGSIYLPIAEREAERVAAIPGVQGAAVSLMGPMQGLFAEMVFRPNKDTMYFDKNPGLTGNAVGPGYFATVGMKVLDGRDIANTDAANSARVVVLSQTAARDAWPNQRAVGQCIVFGLDTNPCTTVVGVVSDAQLVNITPEPASHYYIPLAQARRVPSFSLTVRAPTAVRRQVAQTLRRDLADQLPAASNLSVADVGASLDPRYAQWTEGVAVFTAMGLLALIVAGIGLYSIIGYAVTQRTHEMGVRVALGARRTQVMRPVIIDGVKLAVAGVIIGVGAALAAGKLVASLLYDTSPHDPVTMTVAALILLLAAAVAAYFPARRAAKVDPVIALRAE